MKRILLALLAGIALSGLGGCSWLGKNEQSPVVYSPGTELIAIHYAVADSLRMVMCLPEVCEHPMLMSSFVSLEDLDKTSPLGRVIPQQIGSRLVQHGIQVVDVRLRTNTLLIRKMEGEFALSRDLQQINQGVNAYSVLTGTYSVVYGKVYVNAMILRASDGAVLAALDYTLPVDRRSLMQENAADAPPLTRDQLPDPHQGMVVPSVNTRI